MSTAPSAIPQLREAANLRQTGQEYSGEDIGTLTVVTTHTQARYALPRVAPLFRNDYPMARIVLQQSLP